jgi:hypothetical protein
MRSSGTSGFGGLAELRGRRQNQITNSTMMAKSRYLKGNFTPGRNKGAKIPKTRAEYLLLNPEKRRR